MSSTEPPSRISPRGHSPDSKTMRDELSSKNKVEKVREVDADETRKRQKWLAAYPDKDTSEEEPSEARPSLFDIAKGEQAKKGASLGADKLDEVKEAIVPSPSYATPPNVSSFSMDGEEMIDDENTTQALPQSNDFWEEVDFADRPPPHTTTFKEVPHSMSDKTEHHKAYVQGKEEKEKHDLKVEHKKEKKEEEHVALQKEREREKAKHLLADKKRAEKKSEEKQDNLPSPFEEARKSSVREEFKQKEGQEKAKEEDTGLQGMAFIPLKHEEKGHGAHKEKGQEKVAEVGAVSITPLPANIHTMAVNATTQAAPFLNPASASLFFQMIGTMYVMAGKAGVSRTEIVLNNPSFAHSKFFGATIRIEKYATAPDSFNIVLTGSDDAVASFKENIPSLLSAFQNGNFRFKVNRLDAEYNASKPLFRRKEQASDKGSKEEGKK
jgi:hypothetical protein